MQGLGCSVGVGFQGLGCRGLDLGFDMLMLLEIPLAV